MCFTFHFALVDVLLLILHSIHLANDVAILCLHFILEKLIELILRRDDTLDIILNVLLGYSKKDLFLLLEVRLSNCCNLLGRVIDVLNLSTWW